MIMYRLENNRIVEHWLEIDFPGLVAQLTEVATAAR